LKIKITIYLCIAISYVSILWLFTTKSDYDGNKCFAILSTIIFTSTNDKILFNYNIYSFISIIFLFSISIRCNCHINIKISYFIYKISPVLYKFDLFFFVLYIVSFILMNFVQRSFFFVRWIGKIFTYVLINTAFSIL
jgi:hypothetical protein